MACVPPEVKQQQKTTVTLSMLWIGLMMVASRPGWVRAARDFIVGVTSGTPSGGGYKGDTTGVTHGH